MILDAAEKRLREGGPEAIRLQDIARDVGISHPAILHHFASRDGLTRALAERAVENLRADLVEALRVRPATEATALELLERVFATLGDSGHARLLAWRALGAPSPERDAEPENLMLRELAGLVHARRAEAREPGRPAPRPEDSEFVVRLVAAAMLGDGLFGDIFDQSFGHAEDDPDVERRFRAWLARLLIENAGR